MIRILFIEDEQSSIDPVLDSVRAEISDTLTQVVDFDLAESEVRSFRPDIVVLDLARGNPSDGDYAGLDTYDFIWGNRFCPIVVYSALQEQFSGPEHDFVRKVTKGSGSVQNVLNAIQDFLPHVQALQTTEEEIRQRLSEAMREVAPRAFRTFTDAVEREEVIVRAARRRVAAMMDTPTEEGKTLASWECYIYPPVSNDTLLGDVLIEKDGDSEDSSSFRVVLTPSCDMAQAKVSEILVAKCCSMKQALKAIGLNENTNPTTIRDRLLRNGYAQTVIPFPPLPDIVPAMAADLRDLELIPTDDVGENKRFQRKASVDSPFREMVAWAYMQTACRPGLPERDLDTWALAVREAAQRPEEEKTTI